MNKIDWTVFAGSSHCEEGLADFATGRIKTFKAFKKYFMPAMVRQAEEVDNIKKIGLVKARKLAARAFKRISGLSITDAYGGSFYNH